MGKRIKIAFDATSTTGAGICVIYEDTATAQYILYAKPHSYGKDPATFEMKNGVNVLKQFKRFLDQSAVVDVFCDNPAIDSDNHPDTLILMHQIKQLEEYWGCDIGVNHETVDDGHLLIQAANELSRKRRSECEEILAKLGAKPMRVR